MQTRDKLELRRTVTTLMGLTLMAGAGAQPEFAQATPKPTHSVLNKSDQEKDAIIRISESDLDLDEDDPLMVDAAPMAYPFAAPGSLHLNHWTDYTRTRMAPGSAQEEREARRELMEKRRRARQDALRSGSAGYTPTAYNNTDAYSSSAAYHRGDAGYYDTQVGYQGDARTGRGRAGRAMADWTPMATSGDFVYLVRGTTLFKLTNSDLSILRQQELPAWTDAENGSGSSGASSGTTGASGSLNNNGGQSRANSDPGNVTGAGNNNSSTGTIGSDNSASGNSPNSDARTNTDNTGTSGAIGSGAQTDSTSGRRRGRRSAGTSYSRSSDGRMMSETGGMAPVSITAGTDFVYVLRGSTLFQMRTSDLSLVSRKQLPFMSGYGDNASSFGRSNGSYNSGSGRRYNGENGTNASGSNSNGNIGDSNRTNGNSTPNNGNSNPNNGNSNPNNGNSNPGNGNSNPGNGNSNSNNSGKIP